MKEYIQALIRSQGEKAAGKIAEDIKRFIIYIEPKYYIMPSLIEEGFEEFQDEVLNK